MKAEQLVKSQQKLKANWKRYAQDDGFNRSVGLASFLLFVLLIC